MARSDTRRIVRIGARALAMLMPVAFQLARKTGTPPSAMLMPMAFAMPFCFSAMSRSRAASDSAPSGGQWINSRSAGPPRSSMDFATVLATITVVIAAATLEARSWPFVAAMLLFAGWIVKRLLEEAIAAHLVMTGTPDEVSKSVKAYQDAGADQVCFGMLSTTMPIETCIEATNTFGKHIIPVFDKDKKHSTTRQREEFVAKRGPRKKTELSVAVDKLPVT